VKHDMSAKTEVLGGVVAKFVTMSETEAAKVALDYFGIDGAALRCAGEKDDTFKIAPTNGPPVILKVANPAGDLAEIDLQVRILEHLAVRAPSLPTPRAIANRLGERQFRHRDDAGQDRQIWMMSCVDGRPLSDVQSTPLNRPPKPAGSARRYRRAFASDAARSGPGALCVGRGKVGDRSHPGGAQ